MNFNKTTEDLQQAKTDSFNAIRYINNQLVQLQERGITIPKSLKLGLPLSEIDNITYLERRAFLIAYDYNEISVVKSKYDIN